MKLKIFTFILSLFFSYSYAQQRTAHISFRIAEYNFGKIKEVAGPVSIVFSFINTGSAPIVLQDVVSTCGCTTPEYTKAPVMPGDSGFVKAIYNPSGRPGQFTKDITVKSNADNSPIILRIKGEVEPRDMKIDEQYRFSMGDLKLETSHLSYGRIYYGETRNLSLKMINTGKIPVKVAYKNLPAFIKASAADFTIKPGEVKEIGFVYDTKIKNDWGFLIDYLNFILNNKQDPTYRITFTADINENFVKLTEEQRQNAPFIEFNEPNYKFNNATEGDTIKHTFVFVNKGKSDLIIRKVSSTCGCTVATPEPKIVKAGKSGTIKVAFKTAGYRDLQTKPITVITNDPNTSIITLTLSGNINSTAKN